MILKSKNVNDDDGEVYDVIVVVVFVDGDD